MGLTCTTVTGCVLVFSSLSILSLPVLQSQQSVTRSFDISATEVQRAKQPNHQLQVFPPPFACCNDVAAASLRTEYMVLCVVEV